MARMGKTQEMKCFFRQTSLASFTGRHRGDLQWMSLANSQCLINGSRAGLFWSYVWKIVRDGFLAALLADMASMATTAGGESVTLSMHVRSPR